MKIKDEMKDDPSGKLRINKGQRDLSQFFLVDDNNEELLGIIFNFYCWSVTRIQEWRVVVSLVIWVFVELRKLVCKVQFIYFKNKSNIQKIKMLVNEETNLLIRILLNILQINRQNILFNTKSSLLIIFNNLL